MVGVILLLVGDLLVECFVKGVVFYFSVSLMCRCGLVFGSRLVGCLFVLCLVAFVVLCRFCLLLDLRLFWLLCCCLCVFIVCLV